MKKEESHAQVLRRKAAECRDEAERAPNPETRTQWLKMADTFSDMADDLD